MQANIVTKNCPIYFSGSSHCSIQKLIWYYRRHYSSARALMVEPHNHKAVAKTYKPHHQGPTGSATSSKNAQFHGQEIRNQKEYRSGVQTTEIGNCFLPMARTQDGNLYGDRKGDWVWKWGSKQVIACWYWTSIFTYIYAFISCFEQSYFFFLMWNSISFHSYISRCK